MKPTRKYISSFALAASVCLAGTELNAKTADDSAALLSAHQNTATINHTFIQQGEFKMSENTTNDTDSLWEKTKEASANACEAIYDTTSKAWEATKEGTAKAWDKTKEVSGNAWDATKEGTAKAGDAIAEKSGDAWEATKEGSEKAWDKTKEASGNAWEKTKEGAAKAKEAVSEKSPDTNSTDADHHPYQQSPNKTSGHHENRPHF